MMRLIAYRCLDCAGQFVTLQCVPGDTPYWTQCPLPILNRNHTENRKRVCEGRALAILEPIPRNAPSPEFEWFRPESAPPGAQLQLRHLVTD